MPTCQNCHAHFPNSLAIDGKVRILNRRRYCLTCSPFGRHNTRRIHVPKPDREHACPGCGQMTSNPKFCSNRCQKVEAWNRVKAIIEATGVVPICPSGDPRVAKRYLLETHGRACALCRLTTWQGRPVPLVLDHIDGNAGNWAVANLRMVCGNCDMLLPTYKSKNRGKGRAWRRARYAAGQSY